MRTLAAASMPAGEGTTVGTGKPGTAVSSESMVSVSVDSAGTAGVGKAMAATGVGVAEGVIRSQAASNNAAALKTSARAVQEPNRRSRPESTVSPSKRNKMQ